MVVPDKFALELHELKVVVIHLGDDLRRPVLRELGELLGQFDRVPFHGKLRWRRSFRSVLAGFVALNRCAPPP